MLVFIDALEFGHSKLVTADEMRLARNAQVCSQRFAATRKENDTKVRKQMHQILKVRF